MGRYGFLISVLVFLAGGITLTAQTAAADEDQAGLEVCFRKLSVVGQTSLSAANVKSLIESDLGGGPYPAEFRREFIRDGKVLVTLTARIYGNFDYRDRVVSLRVERLTDQESELREFLAVVTSDLQTLDYNARAVSPNVGHIEHKIGNTPRDLNFGTAGHQSAAESAILFDLANHILSHRIADHTVVDRIMVRELAAPERKF